jgi:hypothetical protein
MVDCQAATNWARKCQKGVATGKHTKESHYNLSIMKMWKTAMWEAENGISEALNLTLSSR